jgi:hypothetical protein
MLLWLPVRTLLVIWTIKKLVYVLCRIDPCRYLCSEQSRFNVRKESIGINSIWIAGGIAYTLLGYVVKYLSQFCNGWLDRRRRTLRCRCQILVLTIITIGNWW